MSVEKQCHSLFIMPSIFLCLWTASCACLNGVYLEEILGFILKMTADTLQTFIKLCAGNGSGGKKRLIMNKFSLSVIHVAMIFYLQHISLGLYIQLMRFQINVKWTAFKLLFSLEAWHWKREGFHQMTEKLLPDPLRSVNRAVLGNAISGRRWWGLFEGLKLLIWRRCGVEHERAQY